MNTIHYYSQLTKHLSSMTSVLGAMAYDFEKIAPRTALDDQLIDGLVATATAMITEAQALKGITFDPTPLP